MFGFFGKKYKKQEDIIGEALHAQIYGAMKENSTLANKNLNSSFFVGYLYTYTTVGFSVQGVNGNEAENYYEYICNNIIPKTLWEIFNNQLTVIEHSKELSIDKPTKDFELGGNVGMWDAANLIDWDGNKSRTNLKSYLLDQNLNYEEPKD